MSSLSRISADRQHLPIKQRYLIAMRNVIIKQTMGLTQTGFYQPPDDDEKILHERLFIDLGFTFSKISIKVPDGELKAAAMKVALYRRVDKTIIFRDGMSPWGPNASNPML